MANVPLLLYFSPLLLIWLVYLHRYRQKQEENLSVWKEVEEAGLTEPASLHPVIDPAQCIGCASCVEACPERKHKVLGLIGNKARLINPTACIGHGACKEACPADAITLVFGTEKRGVDIPVVRPNFETNVPGIFIAGELGGMGLIRNAIEQGRQAMESIAAMKGMGSGPGLDVVIVGAGPAGFAASLGAKAKGLRFVTVEQDSLGGTVFNFPRGKLVMTAPAELPIYGKVKVTETSKEALLELWQKIERETGLEINYHERMEGIERQGEGFIVRTTRGSYETRAVLLCIGRRGTPRKLGVPGEELPKVVYRLIDPEQYRGQRVLVVGGGDSALEAATSIAEQPGTCVTLSYRSAAFSRAKAKNRARVEAMARDGNLQVLMKSNVKEITADEVRVEQEGQMHTLGNDAVIICAGGILPTPFLKEIGIEVETKYGTA
ncbi:MAG TPA: 4Fe-4S dicluster domain-containing protein [Gammaproteobacteria bacterium]|nr:4Fe-4S dicluster domain-containing protein [Gammaproteobacteria bacterium]